MLNLTTLPAFGFETANCHAKDFYASTEERMAKKEIKEKDIENLKMQEEIRQKHIGTQKTAWKTTNLGKLVGYIPVVGSFVGIGRIINCARAPKDIVPNKVNHIIRGIVESLSLGILLIIPDLIITGCREYQASIIRYEVVV